MDIMDFNVKQVKDFEDYQLIGVCKHMCGAGTDLTITSLLSQ